mmetsp:Transcript_31627/g.76558  ORF Transcript_31627/g.76558 Transcript_31627/m.76558 type:complete len:229 (+) Transcript_31627:1-687(+)
MNERYTKLTYLLEECIIKLQGGIITSRSALSRIILNNNFMHRRIVIVRHAIIEMRTLLLLMLCVGIGWVFSLVHRLPSIRIGRVFMMGWVLTIIGIGWNLRLSVVWIGWKRLLIVFIGRDFSLLPSRLLVGIAHRYMPTFRSMFATKPSSMLGLFTHVFGRRFVRVIECSTKRRANIADASRVDISIGRIQSVAYVIVERIIKLILLGHTILKAMVIFIRRHIIIHLR